MASTFWTVVSIHRLISMIFLITSIHKHSISFNLWLLFACLIFIRAQSVEAVRCCDGTYSNASCGTSGACSWHGGVCDSSCNSSSNSSDSANFDFISAKGVLDVINLGTAFYSIYGTRLKEPLQLSINCRNIGFGSGIYSEKYNLYYNIKSFADLSLINAGYYSLKASEKIQFYIGGGIEILRDEDAEPKLNINTGIFYNFKSVGIQLDYDTAERSFGLGIKNNYSQ